MVCFINFLKEFVDSLIDINKELLPARSEHKASDFVKSCGGIVYEKCVFGLIRSISCDCSFWIFPLRYILLLRSNQIQSLRDEGNGLLERTQHFFSFLTVTMSHVCDYLCLDKQCANVELIGGLYSFEEKIDDFCCFAESLRNLYDLEFT